MILFAMSVVTEEYKYTIMWFKLSKHTVALLPVISDPKCVLSLLLKGMNLKMGVYIMSLELPLVL